MPSVSAGFYQKTRFQGCTRDERALTVHYTHEPGRRSSFFSCTYSSKYAHMRQIASRRGLFVKSELLRSAGIALSGSAAGRCFSLSTGELVFVYYFINS